MDPAVLCNAWLVALHTGQRWHRPPAGRRPLRSGICARASLSIRLKLPTCPADPWPDLRHGTVMQASSGLVRDFPQKRHDRARVTCLLPTPVEERGAPGVSRRSRSNQLPSPPYRRWFTFRAALRPHSAHRGLHPGRATHSSSRCATREAVGCRRITSGVGSAMRSVAHAHGGEAAKLARFEVVERRRGPWRIRTSDPLIKSDPLGDRPGLAGTRPRRRTGGPGRPGAPRN